MYQHKLNPNVVKEMKQHLSASIYLLNKHQAEILPTQKQAMMNHLEFVNNMLNDMLSVPQNGQFNDKFEYNQRNSGNNMKVIYSNEGNATIVDKNKQHFKQEWELQFDEGLNINPPCYLLPPQTLTGINNIKRAIHKK
jgi:hypothetical protein